MHAGAFAPSDRLFEPVAIVAVGIAIAIEVDRKVVPAVEVIDVDGAIRVEVEVGIDDGGFGGEGVEFGACDEGVGAARATSDADAGRGLRLEWVPVGGRLVGLGFLVPDVLAAGRAAQVNLPEMLVEGDRVDAGPVAVEPRELGRVLVRGAAEVGDVAQEFAAELVRQLRTRLEAAFADGGDEQEVSDRIRACYREWKTQRIAETAAHFRAQNIAAVIFPVDSERNTGYRRYKNEEVAELAAENSDVLIPFASIDPHKGKIGAREARRLIGREPIGARVGRNTK